MEGNHAGIEITVISTNLQFTIENYRCAVRLVEGKMRPLVMKTAA
jgi:hypothetical protein